MSLHLLLVHARQFFRFSLDTVSSMPLLLRIQTVSPANNSSSEKAFQRTPFNRI